MKISPDDIAAIALLAKTLSGIVIDEEKLYFLERRLVPLAEECGAKNLTDLSMRVRQDRSGDLERKFMSAITTNETSFFRDRGCWDAMENVVVPDLIERRASTKAIRMWSAACSTGQEAYSMAMGMRSWLPQAEDWRVRILATDISPGALEIARSGRFDELAVGRGLSSQMRGDFFRRIDDRTWEIDQQVKSTIDFQSRNLNSSFDELGRFDVILCRNVAIYFEAEARKDLFRRLARQLAPGGFLFVGCTESLADIGPEFTPTIEGGRTYYQPNALDALKR